MKVYKRGKTWWYRFSIGGTRYRATTGTDDERRARLVANRAHAEAWKLHCLGEKPRRTWAEALTKYLKEHESLATHAQYEKQGEWWTEKFKELKLKYLDELHPDIVSDIRDTEYERPKERGGGQRSAADVNRKIALLRAVVNAAYREYRWFQPGEAPPLYRMLEGEVSRLRYLHPSEVERLIAALPYPYGLMARVAVATGLRRANVLRMRWEYVDFGRRSITVPGMVMKNGELLSIPINSVTLAVLNEQRGKNEEWVFPREDGSAYTEIPSATWAAACEKAGLTNLRWHDLRHTWASILRQAGIDTKVIKELGGWKDERMVERYAHLSVSHLMDASSAIDQAFLVQTRHSNVVELTGS